jgi:lipoprotein-anchoring transpeptidase ErfK/SrfK
MADYFSVLSNAVAALDPPSAEARRALYDRARNVLVQSLRAADPPMSGKKIEAERLALESAIYRVEAETLGRAGVAGAAAPAPADDEPLQPRAARRSGAVFRVASAVVAAAAIALLAVVGYGHWIRDKPDSERTTAADSSPSRAASVSYVYLRQPVYYRTTHPVGTIIVDKQQHFIYLVRPKLVALRYGMGVGPECRPATGPYRVTQKEAWPGSPLPAGQDLLHRVTDAMASNPLGARALHLESGYRIHGTNAPETIGRLVSAGCFRLINEDIIGLYDMVPLQTRVVVIN